MNYNTHPDLRHLRVLDRGGWKRDDHGQVAPGFDGGRRRRLLLVAVAAHLQGTQVQQGHPRYRLATGACLFDAKAKNKME